MHEILTNIAVLKLPVLEKILRPIIVYVGLVVLLRIFGKRELAQLNPFDLVVILSLANTVQNAIIGEDNSVVGGLIGATTLLLLNYLVVRYLFGHKRLDELAIGAPTQLIRDGKLQTKNMAKELITRAELLSVAHRQGFSHLEEIKDCSLEPGGVFFIEPKEPRVEDARHGEVLRQLATIREELKALRDRA